MAKIEEKKNSHIERLMKTHEKAFTDIKNYYSDITHNNLDLIRSLKEEVGLVMMLDPVKGLKPSFFSRLCQFYHALSSMGRQNKQFSFLVGDNGVSSTQTKESIISLFAHRANSFPHGSGVFLRARIFDLPGVGRPEALQHTAMTGRRTQSSLSKRTSVPIQHIVTIASVGFHRVVLSTAGGRDAQAGATGRKAHV